MLVTLLFILELHQNIFQCFSKVLLSFWAVYGIAGHNWTSIFTLGHPVLVPCGTAGVHRSDRALQALCFAAPSLSALLSQFSVYGCLGESQRTGCQLQHLLLLLSIWKINCDFFFFNRRTKWAMQSLLQALMFFQLFLGLCPSPLPGAEEMSVQNFQPWAGKNEEIPGRE